jgi:adenosylcobinamide-GDP ribazoletransferase
MTDERSHTVTLGDEFRAALALLTRIPLPAAPDDAGQPFDYRQAAKVFPLVGAGIGAAGGVVLVLGNALGLPALVAVCLAIAATVALTGALHEDGLADTADGFGGGATVTRKLEIMADSRIGTFGAVAVTLSIVLRISTLAALLPAGGLRAAAALIAAETASRGAMVKLWHDLPAARPGGMADRAGPPDNRATFFAIASALVIVAAAIVPTFGLWAALTGTAALIAVGVGCALLFLNQIAGQTGDALGASQQVTAICDETGAVALDLPSSGAGRGRADPRPAPRCGYGFWHDQRGLLAARGARRRVDLRRRRRLHPCHASR